MTARIIDNLRKFQEFLLETGLARSVLALPAPRMLALPSPTTEAAEPANVFTRLVTESEIVDVSRDLFSSGHYSIAVQEAFKAVDRYIATKADSHSLSGTQMMELVFSPNAPILYWSDRKTQSEIDEQKGYHRLYAGAMLGIRNPVTHEFNWVDDPDSALELIVFAQHLIRKAKVAKVGTGKKGN
ncbi:MAG: TIGR02391 family protein [Bosea sp.]|uniref:TIGR02391 family protein n=1 Tax=Bosea sp. (in: a-proteobacteria) TaxID=1871050 RepID=UPI001ACA5243|nr:TIGR02391 family protein [Bosea sp. (in: a-proteobacteria)]MBN9452010.1 TIGR02391 family protein [Bosea sp. (in: a-proteobacteria)]